MNNFDLYKLLNFVVNKDVYAQAISESEFELELKAKNIRHFRVRLGLPEGYKTGDVVKAAESTMMNQADLSPFLIDQDFVSVSGQVTLPGWYYILDFYSNASRSSDRISYQEISSRLRDPQTQPTEKDLVAYIIKKGLMVFPTTVSPVHVLYYRAPVSPVFRTLVNSETHELEYDHASSTELEWDDGNKLDIMHMILSDFGINISRGDVFQYANKLVETGK